MAMSISWEPDQRIRVVLGDAHQGEREELRELLLTQPDIEVIGFTSDGEQALALLRRLRPHVALLDELPERMRVKEATPPSA